MRLGDHDHERTGEYEHRRCGDNSQNYCVGCDVSPSTRQFQLRLRLWRCRVGCRGVGEKHSTPLIAKLVLSTRLISLNCQTETWLKRRIADRKLTAPQIILDEGPAVPR